MKHARVSKVKDLVGDYIQNETTRYTIWFFNLEIPAGMALGGRRLNELIIRYYLSWWKLGDKGS